MGYNGGIAPPASGRALPTRRFSMRLRSLVLLLVVLAIAALAFLNWPALAEPSLVSLGVA